jgi:peptidoglycan/xylan/chitin deacetylase (PgdA/CDA1 family)
MTRFHIALITTALLGGVAVVLNSFIFFGFVLGAFLLVTGLGVGFPQLSFFGPFICRGETIERCVALTFDDGPDARSTPMLLDLLRAEKIEATFFCIGKCVAANPELTSRIVREGHLIANHTFNHSLATNCFGTAKLRDELTRTQAIIEQTTGVKPWWFRPPMGFSNPRIFKVARELDLAVIGWQARGVDTQIKDSRRVVQRVMGQVSPGAIILLHDGNIPADRLAATMKLLLANLREQGYGVVRLDKLLK